MKLDQLLNFGARIIEVGCFEYGVEIQEVDFILCIAPWVVYGENPNCVGVCLCGFVDVLGYSVDEVDDAVF